MATLSIPEGDISKLRAAVRDFKKPDAVRRNCKILLALADGTPRDSITRLQFVARDTVTKVREIYRVGGVDAVIRTVPRRGRPILADDRRALVLKHAADRTRTIREVAALAGVPLGTTARAVRAAFGARKQGRQVKPVTDGQRLPASGL
jgi:hypothetical protein